MIKKNNKNIFANSCMKEKFKFAHQMKSNSNIMNKINIQQLMIVLIYAYILIINNNNIVSDDIRNSKKKKNK